MNIITIVIRPINTMGGVVVSKVMDQKLRLLGQGQKIAIDFPNNERIVSGEVTKVSSDVIHPYRVLIDIGKPTFVCFDRIDSIPITNLTERAGIVIPLLWHIFHVPKE